MKFCMDFVLQECVLGVQNRISRQILCNKEGQKICYCSQEYGWSKWVFETIKTFISYTVELCDDFMSWFVVKKFCYC